jgi:hypothetical protein
MSHGGQAGGLKMLLRDAQYKIAGAKVHANWFFIKSNIGSARGRCKLKVYGTAAYLPAFDGAPTVRVPAKKAIEQ